MKTMDAGRAEMELAAKAGAGVVGVLGAASDSTIRECVEAARNYGCKLIVDLIEVADPVARAQRAQALGADCIGVHCAIDQQMRGEAPFDTLRAVRRGGRDPGLGGRRHQQRDRRRGRRGRGRHRRRRRRHHQVGRRRGGHARDPPRRGRARLHRDRRSTSAPAQPTSAPCSTRSPRPTSATPGTAQPSLAGIQPLLPGAHMCGPAVTVRTYAGDWAKPVEAIDVCKPGDVLVIDACDAPPAVWGELATHSCHGKGLAGLVVIDGAIRDTPEIRAPRFPAFGSKVCANAGEPKGFGEISVPILIAGQRSRPATGSSATTTA